MPTEEAPMQRTTDPTTDELRAQLAQTRRQVARLTRQVDSLSRVLRLFAGLTVDTVFEPAAPDFDDPDCGWLHAG